MSKSKSNLTQVRASKFNEQLNIDLANTFFNLSEFAEEHTIDGRKIVCMFQDFDFRDMHDKYGTKGMIPSKHADGIYADMVNMFVEKSVFGAKPKVGSPLLIDSRWNYRVGEVNEEENMYVILLEAWR